LAGGGEQAIPLVLGAVQWSLPQQAHAQNGQDLQVHVTLRGHQGGLAMPLSPSKDGEKARSLHQHSQVAAKAKLRGMRRGTYCG